MFSMNMFLFPKWWMGYFFSMWAVHFLLPSLRKLQPKHRENHELSSFNVVAAPSFLQPAAKVSGAAAAVREHHSIFRWWWCCLEALGKLAWMEVAAPLHTFCSQAGTLLSLLVATAGRRYCASQAASRCSNLNASRNSTSGRISWP
ncbi:hypothetical protein LR48_Vigan10g062800 [Vigna angularis]|uniref:Uncharacterized protein n=1 Tax=Phaseolus angularis TaxID=3914 RepID=A0A0L9VI53_PHAAN|nr:hypothetical protein LR48_Vigan10g062800 [Vigna angularis]